MLQKVYEAESYRWGAMGSLGDASYMLIHQHDFPDTYDSEKDQMVGWDHDRIIQQDYDHGTRCFAEHTGTGSMGLEGWCQRADPEKIIGFLKDILRADPAVKWTGFRILGTVNRGNGYPVWTLQLFAKHPESDTKVYGSKNAPNLIQGSRYANAT